MGRLDRDAGLCLQSRRRDHSRARRARATHSGDALRPVRGITRRQPPPDTRAHRRVRGTGTCDGSHGRRAVGARAGARGVHIRRTRGCRGDCHPPRASGAPARTRSHAGGADGGERRRRLDREHQRAGGTRAGGRAPGRGRSGERVRRDGRRRRCRGNARRRRSGATSRRLVRLGPSRARAKGCGSSRASPAPARSSGCSASRLSRSARSTCCTSCSRWVSSATAARRPAI